MKEVFGTNIKVSKDSAGALISVDWVCPYCGMWNPDFFVTSMVDQMDGDFASDRVCDGCSKEVSIVCQNPSDLF